MTAPPIYIFYHLSKSGGTSLDAYLARHLEWDREFVNFSNWGRHYRAEHGRAEFVDRPPEERQAAQVLSGHRTNPTMHTLLPNREPRYLTVIREPAARCVSMYNFRRSRGETHLAFDDWYAASYLSHYQNSAVQFFAQRVFGERAGDDPKQNYEVAIKLLEQCWLVADTARLDDVLELLSRALSIPADWETQRSAGDGRTLDLPHHPRNGEQVKKFVTLTNTIRERVWRDSAEDVRLWQWAKTRELPVL